jgi:hypothetical protein
MHRNSLCGALAAIAGLLALGGWMLARYAPTPLDPPEPTPAEQRALATAGEPQRSAALKALAAFHSRQAPTLQVHLVQRTPRGPLVIATCDPDSDDPQATHWLLPWTGVAQKLAQPLKSSCLTESLHLQVTYRHRLVPLDRAGDRVLVLTTTSPARTTTSPASLACWAASLLTLLASLGISRAGEEP